MSIVQMSKEELAALYPASSVDTVDRTRNRRKLKIAQRMLKRAKTPGAKALAAQSVRMLQEMLR